MDFLETRYRQLAFDLVNVKRTLKLAAALPAFFRNRLTLQEAEESIQKLLASRVERFLELARTQIYQRPGSPYAALLQHAGCAFSDLASTVHSLGLETALAKLAVEGVYFTSEEFKGKVEVIRGRLSFRVSPKDFGRPVSSAGFAAESSGTRNAPVTTFNTLESLTLRAMGRAVFYAAHDLYSCAHAVYEPILAGRMIPVLANGKLGIPTDRWFGLNVDVHGVAENRFHYLNARLIAMMGRRWGPGVANPTYIDPGDVNPILEWILQRRRQEKTCCITTVISNAARIARVASRIGISLEGTVFSASGEPLTQAKKQIIEQAGARIALLYGPGGTGSTVLGCGHPRFSDEMHIPQSTLAYVENPRMLDYGDHSIHPVMLTTLHPAAPRFLFNVENGDFATMMTRDCGCALQKAGFTQHIHGIRSFEKMTGEGMNYSGSDLFELMENIFPSEFGGAPGDYQLVEEEDHRGQTRLTLVVHPDLGELDNEKILAWLQRGLAQGSRNHQFISKTWQDAGAFRVSRAVPHASKRGKVLPLYIKPKH